MPRLTSNGASFTCSCGSTHSATADFNRASALDPKRPPWEEVVRAYSQVIERNPEDAEAYHLRAHAHERLGQWEQGGCRLSQSH